MAKVSILYHVVIRSFLHLRVYGKNLIFKRFLIIIILSQSDAYIWFFFYCTETIIRGLYFLREIRYFKIVQIGFLRDVLVLLWLIIILGVFSSEIQWREIRKSFLHVWVLVKNTIKRLKNKGKIMKFPIF